MQFQTIKSNIVSTLAEAEAGRYQTIGFQKQRKDAKQAHLKRFVQVFYKAGDIPKSAGSLRGPVQHDMTFEIMLTVAASAKGDLSTATDENISDSARAAAIVAFQESSSRADELFDDLVAVVYQVLMNALNYDLGMSAGQLSNRWLDGIQKDLPTEHGEFFILTGKMDLTCRAQEEVTGDTGTPGIDSDNVIDNYDTDGGTKDPVQKTGVNAEFPT
ncbi:MAG: hypothetical protein GY862_10450 [Gammaproteobacteria bacterium]|nr:hypothetical protein [Gammaproteobacteria bacterium]